MITIMGDNNDINPAINQIMQTRGILFFCSQDVTQAIIHQISFINPKLFKEDEGVVI